MERSGHGVSLRRRINCAAAVCVAAAILPCRAATQVDRLANLSLQELSDLEVTSVSKAAEPLRSAPATIYVITHDEIVRSGVTSIAEALRLAPNLQIAQLSATDFAVAARGLGGAQDAQNFSNKMLILIDGRSVYSPLYSGVYLDAQDLLLDDIDRIEVISGPGATLWGANAMNGVINIVTRPAYLSDAPLVKAEAGDRERSVAARYGHRFDNAMAFRVYGKAFKQDAMSLADGSSAGDDWDRQQGGFRLDWTGGRDSVSAHGDAYRGRENQLSQSGDVSLYGANLVASWQHRSDFSEWQLQTYYDYTQRAQPPGGVAFALRTYDVQLQQELDLEANRVVWGAGLRLHRYHIGNSPSLQFEPDERSLVLGNAFVQDTLSLTGALDLVLGLKLERDAFSGWTPLPELRLAWHRDSGATLWASAARAVRSPTPFDHDVVEKLNGLVYVVGNGDFEPERVDAFEIGYRSQPWPVLSLSATAFYNSYHDLRSVELNSGASPLPLYWGNRMKGNTYGMDAWAKWQVMDWWRLSPGLRLLYKDLSFYSGSVEVLGTEQAGNDPKVQALLTSSMNLDSRTTFDATLRYVGALPTPHLDSYCQLQASFDRQVTRQLDLSVSGFNLLRARHLEYPAPAGEYIRRSVVAQARWRFQ